MKITSLKFKISASDRYKCRLCGKKIDGKEGFVEIILNNRLEWGNHPSKFCVNCLNELNSQKVEVIKNINKIYPKLVKRIIVRRLR